MDPATARLAPTSKASKTRGNLTSLKIISVVVDHSQDTVKKNIFEMSIPTISKGCIFTEPIPNERITNINPILRNKQILFQG